MFTNYYRLQCLFLGVGLAAMFLAFFGIAPLVCRILAGICFAIGIIFYYKIISVLAQVTDIRTFQVWVGVLSHIATLSAIYLMDNRAVFSALLIGSGIVRAAAGIFAIDAQTKALCKELDAGLLQIALEEQAAQSSEED